MGVGGSWVQFPHFFVQFYFFKEFCPILSSFCGLEGHFQGEIEENFFPPKMCFHTLGGGGGGPGGVEKIHTFYFFFFLKASLISN